MNTVQSKPLYLPYMIFNNFHVFLFCFLVARDVKTREVLICIAIEFLGFFGVRYLFIKLASLKQMLPIDLVSSSDEDLFLKKEKCSQCKINLNTTTIHCKYCNICIFRSEKHSIWLNKCIN